MLYCITPALDGYVMLPDRNPHTQMMMSLNICGMAFYDLWHPHSHLSLFISIHPFCFHPICFCPSRSSVDKTHPWLNSMKLGYHPQILQPWPNLWHLSLWRKCGEMWWKRQTIGTLKETRCHLEAIEVPLMENCILMR